MPLITAPNYTSTSWDGSYTSRLERWWVGSSIKLEIRVRVSLRDRDALVAFDRPPDFVYPERDQRVDSEEALANYLFNLLPSNLGLSFQTCEERYLAAKFDREAARFQRLAFPMTVERFLDCLNQAPDFPPFVCLVLICGDDTNSQLRLLQELRPTPWADLVRTVTVLHPPDERRWFHTEVGLFKQHSDFSYSEYKHRYLVYFRVDTRLESITQVLGLIKHALPASAAALLGNTSEVHYLAYNMDEENVKARGFLGAPTAADVNHSLFELWNWVKSFSGDRPAFVLVIQEEGDPVAAAAAAEDGIRAQGSSRTSSSAGSRSRSAVPLEILGEDGPETGRDGHHTSDVLGDGHGLGSSRSE